MIGAVVIEARPAASEETRPSRVEHEITGAVGSIARSPEDSRRGRATRPVQFGPWSVSNVACSPVFIVAYRMGMVCR